MNPDDMTEYERMLRQQVEDYHEGRLKTYSLEEVERMLGLDDPTSDNRITGRPM